MKTNVQNALGLLTENEVSAMLERSSQTLWRLRRCGKLPYTKVGGRVMYHPHQIEQFIQNCAVNTQNSVSTINQK